MLIRATGIAIYFPLELQNSNLKKKTKQIVIVVVA